MPLPQRPPVCYTEVMDKDFLQFYSDTPKFTHAPGLEVMGALMARLGDPQRRLRCVHIAGTNGKGSCAAMVDAMLRAAGYRTGLYTSPDLIGPWERIKVDGVDITLDAFAAVTARVKAACSGLEEPSFFEKMTAAAFVYFAERQCDYVVLEVGLGGRLDATNVIETPAVSVIMPVGLDHTAVLGDTVAAIAGEKAGIVRAGRPTVCAPQTEEAAAVIRRRCRSVGSPLTEVDITKITSLSRSPEGQRFSYGDMHDVSLSLLGEHQLGNACAAIEAGRALGLSERDIRAGLAAVRWPCRLELVRREPPMVLDGAHNGHGAAALAAALGTCFPGVRFTMVMGVMADKPWREMLALMEPLAAAFICLSPEGPRALPAEELAAAVKTVPARTADGPEHALELCLARGGPVCAFGSLYYIGHFRRCFMEVQG